MKWVWQAARTTNQRLLLGYLSATLLESLLPVAMVLNGRALINRLVAGLHQGHGDVHQLLPWLVLGALLAISNTLIGNLSAYWQQRLQDELNLRIGLDVLQQAARLDLGFLERSEVQDQVERARKHGNGLVAQILLKLVTLVSQLVRLCAIVGILLWIEPLVIGWLCLLTLPFLVFKWRARQPQLCATPSTHAQTAVEQLFHLFADQSVLATRGKVFSTCPPLYRTVSQAQH